MNPQLILVILCILAAMIFMAARIREAVRKKGCTGCSRGKDCPGRGCADGVPCPPQKNMNELRPTRKSSSRLE